MCSFITGISDYTAYILKWYLLKQTNTHRAQGSRFTNPCRTHFAGATHPHLEIGFCKEFQQLSDLTAQWFALQLLSQLGGRLNQHKDH